MTWKMASTSSIMAQRHCALRADVSNLPVNTGIFKHRTADYAWSLVCMAGAIIVSRACMRVIRYSLSRGCPQAMNIPLGSLIFFRALLLALTHLWAQYSPDQPMNLYGFVTLPARYISFALMAMDLLQGGPKAAVEGLTGIISAHVFHYLSEIYPRANPQAANWMATPAWFKRLFAAARGGGGPPGRAERSVGSGATAYAPPRRSGTSTAAAPHRPSGVTGHTWGRGNRLD